MKKFKCKTMLGGLFYSLLFLIIMTEYAVAHRVTVFAWVEGDTVYTESKFSGGRKAKNAPIEVFDSQGHKLLEGKTDENGEFSFKAPKKTGMKIVLVAGMGHKGEWTISADEFEEEISGNSQNTASRDSNATRPDTVNEPESMPDETTFTSPCLTSEDIQDVVKDVLDKKFNPILAKLNKSLDPYHGPSVSDIFGGIGYIFGLVGVGTYVNYRKKKK